MIAGLEAVPNQVDVFEVNRRYLLCADTRQHVPECEERFVLGICCCVGGGVTRHIITV